MPSSDVAVALNIDDELDFADRRRGEGANARDIAKLLKPFGLRTTKVRVDERSLRGYRREDCAEIIARYLPAGSSGTSGTSGTSKPQSQANVPDVPDVPDGRGDGAPARLPPKGELEQLRTVPSNGVTLDEIDELGRRAMERGR